MEIRPKIDWNKGRALQYLLDTPGFGSSTAVLPIYIGDDKTDEDAFEVHIYIERPCGNSRSSGYPYWPTGLPCPTRPYRLNTLFKQ